MGIITVNFSTRSKSFKKENVHINNSNKYNIRDYKLSLNVDKLYF